MKRFLTSLFSICCAVGMMAQTADQLLEQANTASQSADFAKAIALYQKAATQFQQQEQWDNYLKCGVGQANAQRNSGDLAGALSLLDQFLSVGEQKTKAPNEQVALLYKGKGAVYYAQGEFRQAEKQLKKALDIRSAATPNNPDLVREYGNMGLIYRLLNDFNQAAKHLEKAIEIAQKNQLNDPIILTALYENYGITLYSKGYYAEALMYLDEALRLCGNELNDRQFSLMINRAKVYTMEKDAKNALKELRRAQQLYAQHAATLQADAKVQVNRAELYNTAGYAWKLEEKWDSSAHYYQQAMALTAQQPDYQLGYLSELSDIALSQKQTAQAQTYLELAQAFEQVIEPKSARMASLRAISAKNQKGNQNYTAALQSAQQQLTSLIVGYDDSDIWSLPSEAQLQGSISLDLVQNALAFKARCWYDAYSAGQAQQKELDAALQTLFLMDKVSDRFRVEAMASGSGTIWADLNMDAFENAIQIALALFQLTQDEQYKRHALYFSEKSKALSLLAALQKSKAERMAGIPEAELEQENQLRLQTLELEREQYRLQQIRNRSEPEQQRLKEIEQRLFALQKELADWTKNLEQKHPDYYRAKYDFRIADLEAIRAMLQKDQTVLEYFIGEERSYVFKITATTFDIYPIEQTEQQLRDQIAQLRNSIYDYHLGAERTETVYQQLTEQYAQTAYRLYQSLLSVATPLSRRLLIIPSGTLSDLPFDALLTERPQDPARYQQHAYLLRQHIVSYCYSATLLQEMRGRQLQATQGTLLAFAPEFSQQTSASTVRGERFALSPLAFNGQEVENIQKILGDGKILKNKEALEPTFHELASQYRILHFATHGMARDKDPDFSLLAFTEIADSAENEFLYVRELYDMQLNAELVVLSACETGIGKFYRGEGVMSLARAFSYAGAKGIFTTLWSVNDQATAQIIESFYRYLEQGKDKDEALQLAKLDFIEKGNNTSAHPFLWAPYIFVGDARPLQGMGGTGLPWWVMLVAGGLVLGSGAMLLKRGKKEA